VLDYADFFMADDQVPIDADALDKRPCQPPDVVSLLKKFRGELAETWTWKQNPLRLEINLRKGVMFPDKPGVMAAREMVADDVVFAYNRLDKSPKKIAGYFDHLDKVEATDKHTVVFTFKNYNAEWDYRFGWGYYSGIVPKEVAGLDATAFSAKPVGTGPYLLKSYTKGQGATFVKNPAYWQAGQPYLDSIDYRTGQDDNAMLQQIQAGTLDMMGDPLPAAQFTDITTNPDYKDQIVHHTLVDTDYVFMDTQQPSSGPFSNVKVRQAVNYAIDKDAILQISHGAGVAANCIFPPDMPGYDAACNPYPHDVAKAKQLMTDAGFGAGFETNFYTDTTDPDPQIGASIQQDLAAIGIKTNIVSQEFATFLDTIETPHKAPIGWVGWFQDYPDPSDFIDPILSCASAVKGGANAALYCNKAIDAEAAAARGEPDAAKTIKRNLSIASASPH
jgi:ABC-type transport system substrate-binding protein